MNHSTIHFFLNSNKPLHFSDTFRKKEGAAAMRQNVLDINWRIVLCFSAISFFIFFIAFYVVHPNKTQISSEDEFSEVTRLLVTEQSTESSKKIQSEYLKAEDHFPQVTEFELSVWTAKFGNEQARIVGFPNQPRRTPTISAHKKVSIFIYLIHCHTDSKSN